MDQPVIRSRCVALLFSVSFLPSSLWAQNRQGGSSPSPDLNPTGVTTMHHPREDRLVRGNSFQGDVRTLPQTPPEKFERPEFEEPRLNPVPYPGTSPVAPQRTTTVGRNTPSISLPAPPPSSSFEGLDFATWGAGHPPDTNGDVGPLHYIQTINTSIGIYRKSDGFLMAAFVFNTLMSQGNFGNLCDTSNFGDPVALYDTFEDRWVITDFAFNLSGGNPVAPEFQCFAVSKSGDPVSGGWNFYSVSVAGGFGDYPKFGIWPDGLYMSANVFGFGASGPFQNVRVWALNKAQMYAGAPTVQVVSFDVPAAEFTLLPSQARLQTGTPPTGTPNYFSVVWQFVNAISVYKFLVDWNTISTATFAGPFQSLTGTNWSQFTGASGRVPSPANSLDSLYPRLMMQNQYTNFGGAESLWDSHTVGAAGVSSAQAAVRYYQVSVTGGTVAANATQAFTFSPDATVHRFMPSVALDRVGDMAIGYSASNATLNPAIRYAGRLAGDAVNSITQTEQSLIEGTGTQSGTCGALCTRWGDYSAMSLDPDGCTFWFTNLYFQTTGLGFNTRIGAFSFPGCTPAGVAGSLLGTVTSSVNSNPISGATVTLGSRTTSTDVNGLYSFSSLPAGTYPSVTASFPGYNSSTASNIAVSDGSITTQDFSVALAPISGCLTDTTQADFQAGVPTSCDLTTSPGDVILVDSPSVDQQNTTLSNSGVGMTVTTWGGQTFTPSVTGQLTRVDLNMFCSGCTGTTPNLTLSLRATSGNLPTGADLASGTVSGFSSGSTGYFTVNFSTPPLLTAGTMYALVMRPIGIPSPGTYALTRSATDVYAGGQRVSSSNSGLTWTVPLTAGASTDAGFKVFILTGFASSGTFISSVKDSNPASNATGNWSTLSWHADTPAGTDVQFQVAAANSAAGPFNFVGPDSTAGTFFSNGGSLTQFTGNRYLKYRASFSATGGAATSTIHDVTVCFNDVLGTTLVVAAASGTFGGTSDLSATLSSSGTGISGKSVSFTLNGNNAGSGMTDGSGLATASAVSFAGIIPGSYPGGLAAAFAGDTAYSSTSGSNTLTVLTAAQTITFAALTGKIWGDPDFSVSATASSTLATSFGASGSCSVTGSTVHLTSAGTCTITASQAGDANYNAAPDVPRAFTVGKGGQTITFVALTGKILGDLDFTVSANASSTLATSFGASGNCSVTGSTVHLTGAGTCTVTASQAGDANYNAAPDVPQAFAVGKGSQTITFPALAARVFATPDFNVSATASSTLATSFGASGNCSVTSSTVHLTGAGTCTITASQLGNSNYNPATPVPQSFSVAKASQTITFGSLSNQTSGSPDFGVSATASSGLATSFGASGSCNVTSSTVHLTGAGTCTITASQLGDGNYNPATPVPQSFSVVNAKSNQTITFSSLPSKLVGEPDFSVGATASSGLAIGFGASGDCSVTGSTVHLSGAGMCTITASQLGDSNYNPATPVPQSFAVVANPDFSIAPTLPAVAVENGQVAMEHITLTPSPATVAPLTFACSGLPALSSCKFAPSTVPAGSTQVDVTLTISTTSPSAAIARPRLFYGTWLGFSGMGMIGIVVLGAHRRTRKTAPTFAALALTMIWLILLLNGCGGRPNPATGNAGTPTGAFAVTVTAKSGAVIHSTSFNLIVK